MLVLVPNGVLAVEEGFTITPSSITVEKNGTAKIKIKAYNAIGDVVVSSSDSTIATVNQSSWFTGSIDEMQEVDGEIIVTGKNVGTTTIVLVVSGSYFDENATGIAETKTINVTVVDAKEDSQGNVTKNPSTGDTLIYVVLTLTLGALIYSYWYMKKGQESK